MAARELTLFRFWLALGLIGCAVVLYGCLMHDPPGPKNIYDLDKLEHGTAYFILGAWFGALFTPRYFKVFIALVAFGGFIEIMQYFSGYRDGDVYDWVADALGAIVGLALAHFGGALCLRYIDWRVTAKRNKPG
jgi:VanZ family protein